MYKTFLIKYAEIAIKGKNRYIFEDALVKNIKYQLRNVDGSFEVRKESGRVYVETDGDYDYDETVATLSRIFGIVGICPVELHEDEGFDKLCEAVIEHINHVYKDKSFTFKVNARRARKNYPMTSMEINAAVGEKVLEAFPETRVDVHNPQVMINIEIRPMINIYSEEIPGPAVCRLAQQERQCFCSQVESTARLQVHDCKARRGNQCHIFPCTAIYE